MLADDQLARIRFAYRMVHRIDIQGPAAAVRAANDLIDQIGLKVPQRLTGVQEGAKEI